MCRRAVTHVLIFTVDAPPDPIVETSGGIHYARDLTCRSCHFCIVETTRKRLLIDGQQVEPLSGRYFDVLNPATGEIIAVVAEADSGDIDRAVRAARKALEGPWGRMRAADRGLVLQRFAQLLEDHAQELIALESLDTGKPLAAVQRQDLPAAIDTLRYYAGWADKINGQVIPARHDALTYTVREPIGVVGAIVPWNFPLMIGMWKIAPALACGCTVVLKPAEITPLSALRIGELALEAGLPPGTLNIVPGFRQDRRPRHGRSPRHRQDHLHGIADRRPRNPRRRCRQSEARHARTRGQNRPM
jgi:acyl-CoA reductase-like NAD-dependent aldehyde dehydrogenase